jgi:cytochrome c biogenesis factor
MHPALLHTHNLLRWAVLVLGVVAIVRAAQGLSGGRPYAAARRAGVLFLASLHLQVLLGILLFMVSPFVRTAMRDMDVAMGERSVRFFVMEHPMVMIVAAILMTVGSLVAKNARDDAARHRKALVFLVVTMLLVLWGIPWQRALVPGMGA